jgi:hypothetical protein
MAETERPITNLQRNRTLELFLGDLKGYEKKDRKFYKTNGIKDPVWYVRGIPPYSATTTPYGNNPNLETRLILFSDYLVFLTEWTPQRAAAKKGVTAGTFVKEFTTEFVSEVVSDVTWGASELATAAITSYFPSKSIALLGKKPEEMLVNPWSLIIPLGDIVHCELLTVNFILHYLYLYVDHRFEGDFDIGISYHSDGIHSRADGLYKKIKRLLKDYPQRQHLEASLASDEEKYIDESLLLDDAQPVGPEFRPSVALSESQTPIPRSARVIEAPAPVVLSAAYETAGDKPIAPIHDTVQREPFAASIDSSTMRTSTPRKIEEEAQTRSLQRDSSERSRGFVWSWVLAAIFLIASVVVTFLLVDTQSQLDDKRWELYQAESAIDERDSQIDSLQSSLDESSSRISSLRSELEERNSEIDSLNSRLAASNTLKIARVDIVNTNCYNAFVFVNNRLTTGTRPSGKTYFFVPPDTYSIQFCSDPYKSNCGSSKNFGIYTAVYTITITRHPSC